LLGDRITILQAECSKWVNAKFNEIFTTKDASLIEINPLIVTVENTLLALDGKIDFDDNA
jgi:succinyl-CoA synthetase beta subunit